jgi:transcriptional regulator with XRE-family HTH domain
MNKCKEKIKHEALAQKVRGMGYTVTHLAKIVGVSRQEMSRILNGRSQPSAVVLVRICQALGLEISQIIE